jgi:putative flippase GtrA
MERLTQLARSSETRRTFIGYLIVGVTGVALYVVLLQAFVHVGTPPFAAFTLSYVLAGSSQFLMNKYWNFRAFDRAIHHQFSTYAVIVAVNYAIMIAVEEFGMHVLHMTPLWAYVLSIPFNLPIGYITNRFLTFGPGIIALFRR